MIVGYIRGQNLAVRYPKIAADSIAYLTAYFAFKTTDWDGCRKFSHWKCGDTEYTVQLIDDRIEAEQQLNLTAGVWTLWIHGERYRDGELTQRITTDETTVLVNATGTDGGSPYPEVPVSDLERIHAELDKLEQKIESGAGGGATQEQLDAKADKPVEIVVEIAADNTFVIPGYTIASLRELASTREVRLFGFRSTDTGASILVANWGGAAEETGFFGDLLTMHESGQSSAAAMVGMVGDGDAGVSCDIMEFPAEGAASETNAGVMRLYVMHKVPIDASENYEAVIYDMYDRSTMYGYDDIMAAHSAGQTVVLKTDSDNNMEQYGTFTLIQLIGVSHELEFHGYYWDTGTETAYGWKPAIARLAQDGTFTVVDADWHDYAKTSDVDAVRTLVVTMTTEDGVTGTVDYSAEEIIAHVNDGGDAVLMAGGMMLPFMEVNTHDGVYELKFGMVYAEESGAGTVMIAVVGNAATSSAVVYDPMQDDGVKAAFAEQSEKIDGKLSGSVDTSGEPVLLVTQEEFEAGIGTKVTAPATAEVGQTIVVSAVDENGKPTEWEAKSVDEIAKKAAALVDTALLDTIGTGEVTA